ncbi:MAG: GNAT family N-acetyltransferase, partial [Actinomycetota bacterium]
MSDLRQLVHDAIAARRPVDARERGAISEFVDRLARLDRPFDEFADLVHVTASAILLSDDRRRVVLHRHKRLKVWLQPGGHVDADELPWMAAMREASEETGLPVVLADMPVDGPPPLVHVDVHPGGRKHRHLDLRYLVLSPFVPPTPPEGESQDVQWFHWHQAIELADEGLEGILRALQPGMPTLRQARHTDARQCADVYLRSRAFALPTVPVVHADADVRRWMADDVVGRADMWVAELDGVIVGLMVLERDRDGGWIEQLYLDPSWLGRGLGDRFVRLAKERSSDGLELWTFQANEPAQRFYERHGFVEEERTEGAGNE